jgi:hypothetical protein
MYEIIKNYIKTTAYNLDELTKKIDKMYIESRLTDEERDDLIAMATENAKDAVQIDLYQKVVELEHRVVFLETADYAVYKAGYVTKKGEVVKFDYNGDGVLDLLRYDGGRSETSLKPGKIDGWHVVDSTGKILGDYHNGEFTPVEE